MQRLVILLEFSDIFFCSFEILHISVQLTTVEVHVVEQDLVLLSQAVDLVL